MEDNYNQIIDELIVAMHDEVLDILRKCYPKAFTYIANYEEAKDRLLALKHT